jgi:hypothetical protein
MAVAAEAHAVGELHVGTAEAEPHVPSLAIIRIWSFWLKPEPLTWKWHMVPNVQTMLCPVLGANRRGSANPVSFARMSTRENPLLDPVSFARMSTRANPLMTTCSQIGVILTKFIRCKAIPPKTVDALRPTAATLYAACAAW